MGPLPQSSMVEERPSTKEKVKDTSFINDNELLPLFHQLYYGCCGLTSSWKIILTYKRCHTIILVELVCVPCPK